MKFVQYDALEKWAKENHVEFRVEWYKDAHILSVTEHLDDGMCRFDRIMYWHDGRVKDLMFWNRAGKLDEFVELFDRMRKTAPIQPTAPLGDVR